MPYPRKEDFGGGDSVWGGNGGEEIKLPPPSTPQEILAMLNYNPTLAMLERSKGRLIKIIKHWCRKLVDGITSTPIFNGKA